MSARAPLHRLLGRGALLGALCATACGPAGPPEEGRFAGLTLIASAALQDDLSGFQVALIREGSSLDCTTVQRTCVNGQISDPSRYVTFEDASGTTVRAAVFGVAVSAAPSGGGAAQQLTLQGVAVGKDYALVIEALSKDTPPRLAGSACAYIPEVTAGRNPGVTAPIEALSPPVACAVRIAP